ncbi:hypothetical protein MAP00_000812 [Monascus purpureus]|nr:hypothetical protein MAP00_000812 [Monascus purpureus]
MSSETTQPPTDPNTTTKEDIIARRQADYVRFKHYTALTFLVASPILIALPPRRLNNLTALLFGAWCASGNHLLREKTGRGVLDRITDGFTSISSPTGLPTEKAQEVQAKLRAAREAQIRQQREGEDPESVEKELEKLRNSNRGALERVWMAGETEGWKERRLEEERKALQEGKGYGDLIKEHVWDVWTWGESKKGGAGKEGESKEGK